MLRKIRTGDDKMVQEKQSSTRYPNVYITSDGFQVFYYLNNKKKSKHPIEEKETQNNISDENSNFSDSIIFDFRPKE